MLKFHFNCIATFRDRWSFESFVNLAQNAYSRPQTLSFVIETPKGTSLRETVSNELSCVKIGSDIFAAGDDKNKKGKGRKGKERHKKSQNRYISRICRKAPSEPILAKFGTSREVTDVMTRANFGVYRLRGYRGIWDVEFWHLPLKWLVTLTTVLHYRTACDYYYYKYDHYWCKKIC